MTMVIIALWRYRLNLRGFNKPSHVRIIVVGPTNCVVDETCVDVLHHVDCAVNIRDTSHSQLVQKVRELAANYGATNRRLCAFEKELQKAIAKIRFDLDIEGLLPEQLEQLLHLKDLRALTRRSGLTTVRHCILASQSQPDAWLERARIQIGGFPMFVKPVLHSTTCMHARHIACNEHDFLTWARGRTDGISPNVEYIVEECLQNGHEFTAMCSKAGLIGTVAMVDSQRTLFECARDQVPYAVEYLTAEQTRDIFPGIESFVMHTMKSVFNRSFPSLLFIRGYYKSHNSIYFVSTSLEPKSDSHRRLLHAARNSTAWEVAYLESLLGISQSSNNGECSSKEVGSQHHILVNFPTSEGVLLHQTSIPKRTAEIRVVWRVSEGEELYDCDTADSNILQVFLSHTDRTRLLQEVRELINETDITVDRLSAADKHSVCRRSHHLHPRSSLNQLARSCTTTD
uniref:ATP-grasp domain-containing protein n=1 Tax=Parascaris univalens TaxID=6257 RepID=A0A915C504_PARUN